MRRRVALTLGAGILAGCAWLPPGEDATQSQAREGLVRTTLDNGLKVVLLEDHSAPVVSLNVWVRTGGADERPEEWGMAHVFEHMLFKGTERREVGEIARTVESAGGHINAFTSFDMTVYHITMASRDASIGIDVLSDAILHSTFDPAELAKETEVVVEEIRRGDDSPGRILFQEIFETVYHEHPYRERVIGTEESVRSFTREQILDFHARWYVPNNMAFVMVGDFDSATALDQIKAAFAGASLRADLSHARTREPEQTAPRASVVRRDFERTLVAAAWPITAFRDEDTAYLDLLAMVLGSGESSRLYRNLKDQQRIVHQIGASAYTPLDPGVLYVDATLEPEQIEHAVEAIGAEVEQIRALGPSSVELERARVNVLAHEVHEKEAVQGQARKLGYYEMLGGGLEAEQEYLDRVRAATTEDLRRVAVEYLRPERATLVALVPEAARDDLAPETLTAALERGVRPAAQLAAEPLTEDIRRYTLPNGLRVIVKRNDAVPLVAMRLAFLGGQLAETEPTQGISSFLAEMLERGTEQRSSAQIAAEVENIAGALGGFSGRNTFGVTAQFLSETLDTGLDLFTDVVLHPGFPAREIEKLREERIAAIRRLEDNLGSKAFELFADALFVDHPYRFRSIGTEESVKRIDRDALLDYWGRFAHPSNGVLSVVGDTDPDRVVQALSLRFAAWTGPESVRLPERTPPAPPAKPVEVSVEKNKQQVHIVMGFPGLALDDPDGAALEVLTQVLSGQGGRLFLELRDRRSLAYSVSAFSIEGLDPGSFGVYIASAPDKLEESLEGLRAELARLLDGPISGEEISRAQAYLIGSHAISLQRYAAHATGLALNELYSLGATHYLEYASRIEAVTEQDLRRVAARVILLDRPVVAVVR